MGEGVAARGRYGQRIMVPGEPEQARRADLNANGIPIDPTTWQQIRAAAVQFGMPADVIEEFVQALK